MSVATELTRIQTAKADIKASIEAKGVTVPSNALIDEYADYVDEISGGGTKNYIIEGTEYDPTATYSGAFDPKQQIVTTNIPSGFTSIGNSAFSSCSGLTSLTIPNSVTSIGQSTFQGCSGLTSITIPNNVTSIGQYAFKGCTSLTSVTLPNSITRIESETFYQCRGLTSITLPSGMTYIGAYAFYQCSGLTSITVEATTPPSVFNNSFTYTFCPIYVPAESVEAYKTTGNWVTYADRIQAIPFTGKWLATYQGGTTTSQPCDSTYTIVQNEITSTDLISVEMGDCVLTIDDYAFQNCSSLTNITLSSGLTGIGQYAFQNCSSLTSVTLGEDVYEIGERAFDGCTGLTKVTIGSGISWIRSGAFYNTNQTFILVCEATNPPTLDGHIFDAQNGGIYVPDNSVNTYKTANNWSTYAAGIFPISDLPTT